MRSEWWLMTIINWGTLSNNSLNLAWVWTGPLCLVQTSRSFYTYWHYRALDLTVISHNLRDSYEIIKPIVENPVGAMVSWTGSMLPAPNYNSCTGIFENTIMTEIGQRNTLSWFVTFGLTQSYVYYKYSWDHASQCWVCFSHKLQVYATAQILYRDYDPMEIWFHCYLANTTTGICDNPLYRCYVAPEAHWTFCRTERIKRDESRRSTEPILLISQEFYAGYMGRFSARLPPCSTPWVQAVTWRTHWITVIEWDAFHCPTCCPIGEGQQSFQP